jgi:hypothetical protein
MPFVAESTGEENANLYKRGVSEGEKMIAVTEQAKELLRDTKYPEGTAIRESKQHQ